MEYFPHATVSIILH